MQIYFFLRGLLHLEICLQFKIWQWCSYILLPIKYSTISATVTSTGSKNTENLRECGDTIILSSPELTVFFQMPTQLNVALMLPPLRETSHFHKKLHNGGEDCYFYDFEVNNISHAQNPLKVLENCLP